MASSSLSLSPSNRLLLSAAHSRSAAPRLPPPTEQWLHASAVNYLSDPYIPQSGMNGLELGKPRTPADRPANVPLRIGGTAPGTSHETGAIRRL